MLVENKTTEFKREYVEDVKNTVVAFSNTDGGKLFIGLNDDGSVYGVADVEAVLLKASNAIRDAIRPDVTLFTDCSADELDGKPIVVITVQRGTARPYYLAGKGLRPEGVFVRQGASTAPATESLILKMIKETSGDNYEEARSLNQQLSFERTSAFFKKKKLAFKEAQKRTLRLIGEDGTYTNLALLLSEQCAHTIKLAIFEGSKKSVFHDRQELSGSLLSQLEEAFSYIGRFNRTRSEFNGLDRVDMRDYPPEAVREALLNAIVHRDYSFSASTLISIFDDRIEFVTIGGLVKGVSLEDIMLGVSVLRNQHLANVFYRLKLIEAYGTGMLKINECYEDYAVKPQIEASDNAFKITLPNTNYSGASSLQSQTQAAPVRFVAPMEDRKIIITEMFENRDYIVRKDVEAALNMSQASAILTLREMVGSGILVKEGGGKYSRYRLDKK